MQAVILAGGFGSRLNAIIKDVPKPMAPVGSRCFMEFVIESMKNNGINDFVFCVHHMAGKIIDYFGDGRKLGIKIDYSTEESPLGTGGAIGLLRDSLHETFCVLNGDTYLELNLQKCIAKHISSNSIATMAVVKVKDSSRYGHVETNYEDHVVRFCEKSAEVVKNQQINAGLYILEPEIFDYIPENKFVSFENEVLPALLKNNKKISTYPYAENFFDIGVPDDYYNFLQWASKK